MSFFTGLLPSHDGQGDAGLFPVYAPADEMMTYDALKGVFAERKRSKEVFPFAKFGTNQNPYSSCCSHGLRNALVRSIYARTGDFINLQPHSAYAWINGGRDQGAALSDAMKEMEEHGMLTTSDAKASQIYLSQFPKGIWTKALRYRGHAFEARDELTYLNGLARGLFGAIAVDVNNAYMNWNGSGLTPVGNGVGNHCVCAHDAEWDAASGQFVFEGPGSWGEWGDGGHWHNTWKQLSIPNKNHTFYLIEASFDDPEDPTQPPVLAG